MPDTQHRPVVGQARKTNPKSLSVMRIVLEGISFPFKEFAAPFPSGATPVQSSTQLVWHLFTNSYRVLSSSNHQKKVPTSDLVPGSSGIPIFDTATRLTAFRGLKAMETRPGDGRRSDTLEESGTGSQKTLRFCGISRARSNAGTVIATIG